MASRPVAPVIGLDTNVLLRWLIDEATWPDDNPGQIRAVRDLIVESRETFFVNHIVIAETIWVLANPMEQPKAVLLDVMEKLLAAANLVIDGRDAVVDAVAGFRAGRPGFTDHLIGHVNRHAGCEATVTFDKDAGRSAVFRRLAARSG